MVVNYPTLTGSDLTWVNSLPWALPVAAVLGAIAAGRQAAAPAQAVVGVSSGDHSSASSS